MTEGTGAPGTDGRRDMLTVTDNRTGQAYELPIEAGTIRAADLRQIKLSGDDEGLMSLDPAFTATASCRSAITFIDGEKGILRYRGYPIEQLAERSSFLEVAYLLMNGELPTSPRLEEFTHLVTWHTFVHENVKKFIDGFHHDAHPMGILVGTVGCRWRGSSRRCRRSRPSRPDTHEGCRTSTQTTRSPTRPTS